MRSFWVRRCGVARLPDRLVVACPRESFSTSSLLIFGFALRSATQGSTQGRHCAASRIQ
jgi:hypothetical protein